MTEETGAGNGPGPSHEPQPLTRDQVDYAYELIDEIHPIEKYPIWQAYPWLKYVTSRCCYGLPYMQPYEVASQHPGQVDDEAQAKLLAGSSIVSGTTFTVNGKEYKKKSRKQKKKQLSKEAAAAEPLAQLGFGIVAYTGMLYYMIWAFALYTLMLVPVFMFYTQGTAYGDIKPTQLGYATRTLGAMGFSSYTCQSIPQQVGEMTLSCEFGVIGEVTYYGVNPGNARGTCMGDQDNNRLCDPSITFKSSFADAPGNRNFSVQITQDKLWNLETPPAQCLDQDAFFFSQFTCVQTEDQLHDKYFQMATTCFICCVIAYWFTISLRHLYQGGKLQQLEWDMATITAGDYTVELNVNADCYRQWYNHEFRRPGGDYENKIAPALSLKQHMIREIEEELTAELSRSPLQEMAGGDAQLQRRNTRREDKAMTRVVIADIVFSFNNAALIGALQKRGKFIATQKFDKMRQQDEEVNRLFEDFDKLTVPTSAFITFEEEDGKVLALKNQSQKQLLGQTMKFINASEPTDIIWENRHFTSWDYIKRQALAFVIIAILLFGSFIAVYIVASYSSKIANTYPQVNCDLIVQDYGTLLGQYAVDDYDYIQANPGKKSSGTLQCFCQQQTDLSSKSETRDKYYPDSNGEQICDSYYSQVTVNFILVNGLSYVLTGINFILRTVCIMLIDWVGFATETERLSKTTTVTFLVQFFNTAFLLLLVGANMSEQPITFWLDGGQFSDFDEMWFRTIGNTLVGTMWFNAWFPILEVLGYFGLRLLFRLLDRGLSCDRYKTKTTSIQAYLDTYTGPVYFMHYKYSTLLNVVFVTFMYGLGIPILFPIACLSCFILYFLEKTMLYYGYRVPPMYDERLSQNVLDRLQTAPILFILFGYWMASNQQLLSNDNLSPRTSVDQVTQSNHTMGTIFDNRGWTGFLWTMLLTFLVLLFLKFGGNWAGKKIESYFPSLAIGDIEIDEDIDNYWESLDDEDRKWSNKEEENARNVLNMPLMTDQQWQQLQSRPMTKGKTLQGCHSYDILANPLYLDDFQYVTAAEDDRDNMIIDDDQDEGNDAAQSDFVRVALNLAYLTENEARQFKFDKRQMDELRQGGEARANKMKSGQNNNQNQDYSQKLIK